MQPIGTTLSLAGNRMRVVEPEFAFRTGAPLPPRSTTYAADEVLEAVTSLHPAFEVPDSRFADFARAGKAQLIADDAAVADSPLVPLRRQRGARSILRRTGYMRPSAAQMAACATRARAKGARCSASRLPR